MNSRWGALLTGENTSLESVTKKINGSVKKVDDFFISMVGSLHILRSNKWDAASDVATALQLASEDFLVIAGCLDIVERRRGLDISSILEFKSDGTIDQTAQIIQSMPRKSKPEASPGEFKRLIIAASSPYLAVAISDFRGDGDWYSLYKVFEGLKRHYGGEDQLFSAFPTKKADLIRLRKTANSYRHSAKAFAPVSDPIGLNAAKALLESLFQEIAEAQPYPDSPFANGQVHVDNYSEIPIFTITAAQVTTGDQ